MKYFYKALFLGLHIFPLFPIFAANTQPTVVNKVHAQNASAFLKEGCNVSLGVFLGFLTGGTCAVADFASGGKSMPFTWATSFFIRWKFSHSLAHQSASSESRCASASLFASWATYGLVMLWLVMKRIPRS